MEAIIDWTLKKTTIINIHAQRMKMYGAILLAHNNIIVRLE